MPSTRQDNTEDDTTFCILQQNRWELGKLSETSFHSSESTNVKGVEVNGFVLGHSRDMMYRAFYFEIKKQASKQLSVIRVSYRNNSSQSSLKGNQNCENLSKIGQVV